MEKETLAGAFDTVLPVRHVRGPGIAQHWQNLFSQTWKSGKILAQLQVRKFIFN
ncbi:unnamed protein product, partial [marine sediment metagenome]